MELEKKAYFSPGNYPKAWSLGILNLSIPESVKDLRLIRFYSSYHQRTLLRRYSISTSAMCNDLANTVIAQHGTDEQKALFLSPLSRIPSWPPSADGTRRRFRQLRHDNVHQKEPGWNVRPQWQQVLHYQCILCLTVYRFCKVGKPTSNFMACLIVPPAGASL